MVVKLFNNEGIKIYEINKVKDIYVIGLKVEIVIEISEKHKQNLEISLNDFRIKVER